MLFFECQRLVARAQHLVFEGFEFVGDVAFAVFQGLAAYPVQRGEVALAARDFDVVAVDVVVAHFQVVEAAFLFFGGFQFGEDAVAVVRELVQAVEFGVVAGGDDAAVFGNKRRAFDQRARQVFGDGGKRQERRVVRGEQGGGLRGGGEVGGDVRAAV